MNDEIKEAIMQFQTAIDFKEAPMPMNYSIDLENAKILLDYITNLQKTNKNHSKKLIELGDKITILQQEKDNLYLDNTLLKLEKDIYKQGYEELKELIEKTITEVNNE